MERTRLRKAALAALAEEFDGYEVTDEPFVEFSARSKHLVLLVGGDTAAGDEDGTYLDGSGSVSVDMQVMTASESDSAQDVLDARMDRVHSVLLSPGFGDSVGVVSISYGGYEFEIEEGFAIGRASFVAMVNEEVTQT